MTNIGKYGSPRMVYGIPYYGDTSQPSTSIESSAFTVDGYARISPVSFVVNFLEPVFDFTSADFSITNGSVQSIAGVGDAYTTSTGDGYRSYSFEIVPTSAGTVLVSIPGGNAFDASGNTIASDSYSFIYDNVGPIPTISSETVTNGGATGNNTNSFTVTFNEPVYGFASSDILITSGSGTVSNFSGSEGSSVYTFDLTISSGASISFRVPSSVCQDYAGNNNSQSALFSFSGDITKPTVALTSSTVNADGYTNSSTVNFTATFSESVTGFTVEDITASGGTLSDFSGSGTTYTFTLSLSGQGLKSVSIAANVCQDAAGNTNTASNTFSFTYDLAQPTVALTSATVAADGYTNTSPILFTATFSESVTGFVVGDITASGGEISNFSGSGAVYTFNFTPSSEGSKSVSIAAEVAQDAAGNTNVASNTFSFTYDLTQPTVTLTSSNATEDGYTNYSMLFFTATFSEPVTGLTAGEITAPGGDVTGLSGSGTTYTFTFSPSTQGPKSVSIAAGVAQDAAGNTNTASNTFSFIYDNISPIPTVSSADVEADGYTTNAKITLTITFSEPVTGFTLADLSDIDGFSSLSNFVAVSSTVYTVDSTRNTNGAFQFFVPSNKAQDAAGNLNVSSNVFRYTYDNVRPSVAISSASVVNGGASTSANIPFTITFSEAVSGFAGGEITVSGGTIDNFAGSGAVYTFNFITNTQGSKSISIAENVASDNAGNLNTASSTFTFTYDNIAPTVSLTASVGGVNKASGSQVTNPVINFGATFSEAVSQFVAADVDVTNGTLSNFTAVSDSYYTFTVTAASQGTVTAAIQAGVAQDAAGNTNLAASSFNIVFDNLGPQITITSGDIVAGGTTRLKSLAFTVLFGESVAGFDASDIQRTNCTISNFTAVSGTTYTFTLVPGIIGEVSFTIPQNTVLDQYSNGNAAKSFGFFYGRGATGNVSGTLLADTVWVDNIRLTGRVVVPNGITLTIDPSAYIQSDGHAIIVEDGGVLNTGNARLPKNSILRSVILITE